MSLSIRTLCFLQYIPFQAVSSAKNVNPYMLKFKAFLNIKEKTYKSNKNVLSEKFEYQMWQIKESILGTHMIPLGFSEKCCQVKHHHGWLQNICVTWCILNMILILHLRELIYIISLLICEALRVEKKIAWTYQRIHNYTEERKCNDQICYWKPGPFPLCQ